MPATTCAEALLEERAGLRACVAPIARVRIGLERRVERFARGCKRAGVAVSAGWIVHATPATRASSARDEIHARIDTSQVSGSCHEPLGALGPLGMRAPDDPVLGRREVYFVKNALSNR